LFTGLGFARFPWGSLQHSTYGPTSKSEGREEEEREYIRERERTGWVYRRRES